MFAGEALPIEVAKAWMAAAPNSTLENLYGPTEATIVCVGYGWDPAARTRRSRPARCRSASRCRT